MSDHMAAMADSQIEGAISENEASVAQSRHLTPTPIRRPPQVVLQRHPLQLRLKHCQSPPREFRRVELPVRIPLASVDQVPSDAVGVIETFGSVPVHRLAGVVLIVPGLADARHLGKSQRKVIKRKYVLDKPKLKA